MSTDPDSSSLPAGLRFFERGWLSSNAILLQGPDGCTLVDSGYSTHSDQTVALVRGALGVRPLEWLLNTHLHSDHCGGNAALQNIYPEMQTLIPPGLSQSVREWDQQALTYTPTGQQCPRFRFDGLLVPGREVSLGGLGWQVHGAPGHDPHSVILFEPTTRTLISADALWENGFGIVFEELEGIEAFDEVSDTLDLIESLAPEIVIPGHGAIFIDVAGALVNARSRLESFVRDPVRHARHAAKVLLKFKLLEVQQTSHLEFRQWASDVAYFGLLHQRFFETSSMADWLDALVADLVRSGAARREDDMVWNA